MSQTNAPNNNKSVRAPPALDPSRPALVQPYRDFVQMGWITELNLKFTPTGHSIVCKPDKTKFPELGDEVSVGVIRDAVIKAKLWEPRGAKEKTNKNGKKEDMLPKKSLCKKDFEGNDASLVSRARSVAKALGDNTGRGRIGSKSLGIENADTFEKWWEHAEPEMIIQLLADKKHLEELSNEDINRLSDLLDTCPFRGPVPTPNKDEATKPVKKEPSGKGKKGESSK
jgi:hypothetical protein